MLDSQQLTTLLNTHYLNHYHTKIIGGFDEPFYLAAKGDNKAEIQFTHDYIRSALHELAHWCTAGTERRKIDDFGYCYVADGRSQAQQDEFFKVEVIPQTYEWAFSLACGIKFEASVDNLHNIVSGVEDFKRDLYTQLKIFNEQGFPTRVAKILKLFATTQIAPQSRNERDELYDV